MTSNGNQGQLRLSFGVIKPPKDAPESIVRRIDCEAQAIAVSMKSAGCKLAYVAAVLGRSLSEISRYRTGKRHMPDCLVQAFCNATGSNLLRQYRAMREMFEVDETARLADLLRGAA